MKRKPFKTLLEISLLMLIGFSIFAFWNIENALALGNCNEGFRVNAGQTKEINCHGVCKKVTNTGSEAKFVPTKSSNEWHQFRLYAPNISLNKCCTPKTCSDLGKECGTWSDGCGGTVNCGNCNKYDKSCSKTYNDYCSGKTLVDYDGDCNKDSYTKTDSFNSTCNNGKCSRGSVDCSVAPTKHKCKGKCGYTGAASCTGFSITDYWALAPKEPIFYACARPGNPIEFTAQGSNIEEVRLIVWRTATAMAEIPNSVVCYDHSCECKCYNSGWVTGSSVTWDGHCTIGNNQSGLCADRPKTEGQKLTYEIDARGGGKTVLCDLKVFRFISPDSDGYEDHKNLSGPSHKNWDWDCDGIEKEKKWTKVGNCDCRNGGKFYGKTGWKGSVPNCGNKKKWFNGKKCTNGWWSDWCSGSQRKQRCQ